MGGDRRRWFRRRPAGQRPAARHAAGQAAPDRPSPVRRRGIRDPVGQPVRRAGRRAEGGARRDLGLRPAQPVALLLRPRHRRPLDRRRWPGVARGGGPLAGGFAGWPELRLEHDGGDGLLRPRRGLRPGRPRAPGRRVRPRPRAALSPVATSTGERPRRGWRAPTCTRTTAAAPSGASRRARQSPPPGSSSSRVPPWLRSARTRPASSTSWTSPAVAWNGWPLPAASRVRVDHAAGRGTRRPRPGRRRSRWWS